MQEPNQKIEVRYLDPSHDFEEIRKIWLELQEKSTHSFFTSWGWIETWLTIMPPEIPAKCVVGTLGLDLAFCCVLVEKRSVKRGLFYKNRAYLNSTGDPVLDALTIEYNGLLISDTVALRGGVLSHRAFKQIEEFCLPGIRSPIDFDSLFDGSFFEALSLSDRSYFVDLDGLRSSSDSYLQKLSANRRAQIRKSIRILDELGDIRVREATDVQEALAMLDSLAEFHQAEWLSRGEPGAFSSDYFTSFHKNLIQRRFDEGEIQLLEISAGDTPIGYLYSFLYQREVLFYQSGFNYAAARNGRPGIVSHYFSILHNFDKGFGKYNFLAGDAQYKESLATSFETLDWLVVSRKNLKSLIESRLRALKRALVGPRSD